MRCPAVLIGLWVALVCLATTTGWTGTHTWTGGSTSGLWSTAANWENNDPPSLGESPLHLVFPTNATRRFATNNFGGLVVNSITLHGAAYTLAGLAAGTNLTVDSSLGNSWWNVRVISGTGHTFHYSLNLLLDGNLEFNVSTNAIVTVRSRLSAATANSGLTKDGPGSVILRPIEDNTFNGTTTINDGSLFLNGSHNQFGFEVSDVTVPGPLVIGNISPTLQPQCVVEFANQIADTAPVTVLRNGTLLLLEHNDTIGALTMVGGEVEAFNSVLTLNGNVLVQNPPGGSPSLMYGRLDLGILGRNFTVETNAELYVYSIISGGSFGNAAAGVSKYGPGYMALQSTSNTFGGYLHVGAGTLAFTREQQLGAHTNGTTVASNAVLILSGVNFGAIVNDEPLSLAGGATMRCYLDGSWNAPVSLVSGKANIDVPTNVIFEIGGVMSGVGGFNKTGPGELLLTGFENNTFTGVACVDDGLLSLDKAGIFTNAIAISGPLVIGTGDDAKQPVTLLFEDETISPTVPVIVNRNGELQLADHDQTVHTLAVNGGVANSGTFGVLRLISTLTSTNDLTHSGSIHGWFDLGNAPREFRSPATGGGWLRIFARIIGGASATLNKYDANKIAFHGANTYSGTTHVWEGEIEVCHPTALGATSNGTVVHNGAALFINSYPWDHASMTVTNETLSLQGYGFAEQNGAMASFGTNIWDGLVILENTATIRTEHVTGRLTFSRRVEGPGGLTKIGFGKLAFIGVGSPGFNNTYTGPTLVQQGELLLNKDSIFYNRSLAGDLNVIPGEPGDNPVVRVQGREQFTGNPAVTVAAGGQLRFEYVSYNAIGSLAGNGVVDFATGTRLVTGLNGQNTAFVGTLQGGGVNDTNISMQGTGIFTLGGANNLLGKTEVTGGILRIDSVQPAARVEVKFQGSVGGTGSVNVLTMRGGWIKPGSPLGKLRAASYVIGASHALHIDIHGPALGSGYDQFEVDTTPDLSFTQLGAALGNNFNPAMGQTFLILRNNSGAQITQPFMGFAEGASFYVDNLHRMQISYVGGDGNDVVLTAVAGPAQMSGVTVNGNRAYVNGTGTPGAVYHVEATTTVANPASWVDLGTVTAGPDGALQYVDADMQTFHHRFFRFVVP